jgi:hypothetical protein
LNTNRHLLLAALKVSVTIALISGLTDLVRAIAASTASETLISPAEIFSAIPTTSMVPSASSQKALILFFPSLVKNHFINFPTPGGRGLREGEFRLCHSLA